MRRAYGLNIGYACIVVVVLVVSVFWPRELRGAEFFAAPDGTPEGTGDQANPWDLQTALSHPARVQPGDTIWLRGGTYAGSFASDLSGEQGAPIVVRSFPGEWARIDLPAGTGPDTFVFRGQWTWYWGFELFCSDRSEIRDRTYLAANGRHLKFINLIIHDVGNNSFGRTNEIYGSILYHNGADGSNLAHHLYTQNDDPENPAQITECIIFSGYGFGVHGYGEGGSVRGLTMVGNVWFKAGSSHSDGREYGNCLVGTRNIPPESIVLRENMGWAPTPGSRSVELGRYNDVNIDVTLIDNYFKGETEFTNTWQSIIVTGNTFYPEPAGAVNIQDHPANTYLTERPVGATVFVRPNQYEPGRAHIVVYNWDLADRVTVDVGAVLNNGDEFQIRNAQDYFASPMVAGTFDGAALELPMTDLHPAQPIGPGEITPDEETGPEFNVFVLIRTSGGSVPPQMDGGASGNGTNGGGGCGCAAAPLRGSSLLFFIVCALLALLRGRGKGRLRDIYRRDLSVI